MNDSYTIIRRFTPPTCTLEIWGKDSPLSRWTKKTTVKDVRFKLSFDDPRMLEIETITISGDRNKLEQLYDIVLSYTENFLEKSFASQLSTLASSDRPFLQSQGLVNHQFNLGNLTSEKNVDLISLSATQLFDLVSALEEYKTEMTVLTQLEAKQNQKTLPLIPIAMSVAGILLAVGLTTVGIKVANQSQTEDRVASTQESQPQTTFNTKAKTPIEDVIPPEVPKTAEKPVITSQKNDPLSSIEKLPPPPAVETFKPQPDIPDPAKYPPSGNLTIPSIADLPEPIATSKTAKPQPNNSQVESTIKIPSEKEKPIAKTEQQTTTKLEISPNTNNQITQAPTFTENSDLQLLDTKKPTETTIIDSNAANSSNNSELETKRTLSQPKVAEEDTALNNVIQDNLMSRSASRENEPESKIPQVKQIEEVTSYFQQKWRSPSELKQTLEYRLVLNQNGSLKRVIPIGKAAEVYLDRTNIPLMGEPFVSALEENQNITVRLLLSPDGEVRTFLE